MFFRGGPLNVPDDHSTPAITTLSSREVYRNRWMRVREDEILRSNGKKGVYGVVEKHDCAIIIPIDNGQVWLVEQFRYPIQQRTIELPQGGWEQDVANPEELARGELMEETGLHAARMLSLGSTWIAYGYSRQLQHIFLATGLNQAQTDPDDEEHDLIIRSMPVDEFEKKMLDGEIRDTSTIAAWGLYLMWKARQA
jgi:8-oxo-dGTP pyrophosphatase MutT (NUDIX family)